MTFLVLKITTFAMCSAGLLYSSRHRRATANPSPRKIGAGSCKRRGS